MGEASIADLKRFLAQVPAEMELQAAFGVLNAFSCLDAWAGALPALADW